MAKLPTPIRGSPAKRRSLPRVARLAALGARRCTRGDRPPPRWGEERTTEWPPRSNPHRVGPRAPTWARQNPPSRTRTHTPALSHEQERGQRGPPRSSPLRSGPLRSSPTEWEVGPPPRPGCQWRPGHKLYRALFCRQTGRSLVLVPKSGHRPHFFVWISRTPRSIPALTVAPHRRAWRAKGAPRGARGPKPPDDRGARESSFVLSSSGS